MASIYDIKPLFQRLLRPLVRRLAAAGVTANQVTIAAVLLSVATGATVYLGHGRRWLLLSVPAVLFVRMALNAIDGMLAREHDMKTRLGAVLNEVGDVLSDSALYLPLAVVDGISPVLAVAAVVLAVITEMTGVVAVMIGASRRYDGPMGKSDRAFVFGVITLLLGLGLDAGRWVDIVLVVVLLASAVTILNRARRALKEVR